MTRRRPTKCDPSLPKRAVVVTRLSKKKDDVSHETQEKGSRTKAEALGMEVVAVFRDDNISGDRFERDGLQRALALIKAGEADVLLVYAYDRLARSVVLQLHILWEVRRSGGEVLSATEQVASGPIGDAQVALFGMGAEMYISAVRDKSTDGYDARFRQKKRYKPGPKALYGYRKVGTGADATWEKNPAEADILRGIFDMLARGESRGAVARSLNAAGVPGPEGKRWHEAAISRLLDRPVYWTGVHECGRTKTARDPAHDNEVVAVPTAPEERYHVGGFPILVDPGVAAAAAAAAARNRWMSRREDRNPEDALLRYGFVVCAGCDKSMTAATHSDGTLQYKCPRPARCPTPAVIAVHHVDESVLLWVLTSVLSPEEGYRFAVVASAGEPNPAKVAALAEAERLIGDLEARAAKWMDDLELLTGAVRRRAADRLNGLNAELGEATTERDRLAAAIARETRAGERRLLPLDAIAQAGCVAMQAMEDAAPESARRWGLPLYGVRDERGERQALDVSVPDSWAAYRAALSILRVKVEVNRRDAGAPRWTARMTLPAGGAVAGDDRWFYPEHTPRSRRARWSTRRGGRAASAARRTRRPARRRQDRPPSRPAARPAPPPPQPRSAPSWSPPVPPAAARACLSPNRHRPRQPPPAHYPPPVPRGERQRSASLDSSLANRGAASRRQYPSAPTT